MKSLSSRLQRRIAHDFPQPGSAAEVVRLLAETSDSERIQAAVVIAAKGDLREIKRQAELAVVDWRDVLMNAGIGRTTIGQAPWTPNLGRTEHPEPPTGRS